ncbi:hypothetical protein IAQ61_010861 [Plenodomus lingam]|nr:hypothetical protein IAQ61_010861 [Plenodomus lingam]
MTPAPNNRFFAPTNRASRTNSTAHSLISESAFSASPYVTPRASPTTTPHTNPPPRSRTSAADLFDNPPEAKRTVFKLPGYWTLQPTVPTPFAGTLEASLDAIQEWAKLWVGGHGVQRIVNTMLKEVDTKTNWCNLIRLLFRHRPVCSVEPRLSTGGSRDDIADELSMQTGHILTEELLFLVTRTLLPEQIAENRAVMARLYDRKKHLAIRLVLRYDMLLAWKMHGIGHGKDHKRYPVVVNSVAPPLPPPSAVDATPAPAPEPEPEPEPDIPGSVPVVNENCRNDIGILEAPATAYRRPLMPNVWPTLLLFPPTHPNGFSTHGVRDRMRHHVTELDGILMYTDEEVSAWSDGLLIARTASALLLWQWLRGNNEILGDMEVDAWEDLDGRADDCDWIAD